MGRADGGLGHGDRARDPAVPALAALLHCRNNKRELEGLMLASIMGPKVVDKREKLEKKSTARYALRLKKYTPRG